MPGSARARNAGIARSTGERIVFIDDDVLPLPNFVEEHLRTGERHPQRDRSRRRDRGRRSRRSAAADLEHQELQRQLFLDDERFGAARDDSCHRRIRRVLFGVRLGGYRRRIALARLRGSRRLRSERARLPLQTAAAHGERREDDRAGARAGPHRGAGSCAVIQTGAPISRPESIRCSEDFTRFCEVSISTHAFGAGWPASTATVSSIAASFEPRGRLRTKSISASWNARCARENIAFPHRSNRGSGSIHAGDCDGSRFLSGRAPRDRDERVQRRRGGTQRRRRRAHRLAQRRRSANVRSQRCGATTSRSRSRRVPSICSSSGQRALRCASATRTSGAGSRGLLRGSTSIAS